MMREIELTTEKPASLDGFSMQIQPSNMRLAQNPKYLRCRDIERLKGEDYSLAITLYHHAFRQTFLIVIGVFGYWEAQGYGGM